jgi:hypothetical protein
MLEQIDFHELPPAAVGRMLPRAQAGRGGARQAARNAMCHHAVATA